MARAAHTSRPFLFEESFRLPEEIEAEAEQEAAVEEPPEPTFSEADLAAARAAGFADGHAKGVSESLAGIERATMEVLQRIAAAGGEAIEAVAAANRATRADALALAIGVATRIAPEIARRPELSASIETFLEDVLGDLTDEPRVVIRIAEPQLDDVAGKLDAIRAGAGFHGQITALAEPALEVGDCRVEWADGGIERRLSRKIEEIEALCATFLETLAEERRDPEDPDPAEAPETAEVAEPGGPEPAGSDEE